MPEPKDRWHPPMTTDISKLKEFGDKDYPMGDYPGDYPWERQRKDDEIGTPTLEETEDYYDQCQPEALSIKNRNAQNPN